MPITGQTYFLPTQITGCSLWLDAADSSTVILSGVNVTQWNDKSGNAANATASGNGILYTQSAINSKPAILLPGNSTYTFFTGTSISGTLNQAIFIVTTTISGITQYSRLLSFGGAGDYNSLGNMVVGWNSPGGVLIERNGIFLPSTNALVYSTPFITSSVISGTSVLGYINGTNTLTGTTTSTNFTHSQYEIGSYTNGGGYTWYGYVGEVIIYNSAILDTQRQQVESYLAQKWGLVSSLAAGHLNETFPAGSPTAIQPYVTSIKTSLTNTIRLAIFSYTGSIQTYTVPAGKTSATIYIWGAAGGGDPYGNSGGAGAFITGIMPVTAGTTYYIVVGGGGRGLFDYPALYVNPGGYGGGATGYYAAGGGGYSGIFSGLTPAQGNTLLLAGGGGGAGPGGYGGSAAWSGTAQAGGGGGVAGSAGQGGTTSAGGAAGTPQTQGIADTTYPGTALAGGNGAQNYGGAGGGGYWGGGGGTYNNGANGGGGGSSYSNPTYLFSVSGAQSTTGSGSTVAPGNTNPYYVSGVGAAGVSGASGGNGLIVIN